LDTANLIEALLKTGSYWDAESLLVSTDQLQIEVPSTRVEIELSRASILSHHGAYDTAMNTLQEALSIARAHALPSSEMDVHKHIRDLCQLRNDFPGYIEHNNEYSRIREEISGKETATKLAMQEKQREIDAREKEVQRHMAVLHSTLPKHIADRVARGEVVNDSFDNAAVLFLDVVGFTTHSSELDAGVVVQLLQDIFTTFDAICAEHDVMKIKTIGDSYMAVAFGIANSEQRIANVAKDMMEKEFVWPNTNERVQFRIGLHCGPVVAGVLGTERMQYDVWGDTVNVASRMESTSDPGRIHISEALAKVLNEALDKALNEGLIKPHIVPRGEIEIKGKGMMKSYWLE
jgi:class 3 adenylate cyclase